MTGPHSIQQSARVMDSAIADIMATHERLGDHLDRMIDIQCEAYPAHWDEADKRELAIEHLGMGQ